MAALLMAKLKFQTAMPKIKQLRCNRLTSDIIVRPIQITTDTAAYPSYHKDFIRTK